jgi:hypothetical protein
MQKFESENTITLYKSLGIIAGFLLLSACGGGSGAADDPDPTVSEQPIAYVKRATPIDNNNNLIENDLRDPAEFRPGAHLIVKNVASLSASEIDITDALIGDTGDVRDPEFNYDGTKLLFSLHMEDNNNDPDINWDIYEYDLTMPLSQLAGSENPRRVMFVDNDILGHDIAPHYLPGDRIVFSSTRAARTGSISLAEGNSAFSPTIEATDSDVQALNLHIMDTDGSNIRQITFNMSHDLDPSVIRNIPGYEGHILFSRWENSPGRNQMSIYISKPDGSEVKPLYGSHSHQTGTGGSTIQFSSPKENSSGNVVVLARDFTNTQDGGDPVVIDVSGYLDNTVAKNTNPGGSGPAQQSVSNGTILTNANAVSMVGRYGSVVPLLDGTNRAIASYSLCLADILDPVTMMVLETRICSDPLVDLNDVNTVIAPPRYGIYVLNLGSNSISPITVAEPDTYYTDVAIAQGYTDDGLFIDNSFNLADPKIGTIHIRSVYDLDGTFNPMGSTATSIAQLADPAQATGDPDNHPTLIERPAMFLRIVKGTYLPDDDVRDFDNAAYGLGGSGQLMRQVIGYVPIDPDGSVRFNAPADVPLSFSILDRNGRRVNGTPRHNNWITLRPGEEITCHGCHNHNSGSPHGNLAAQPAALNGGADTTLTWPNIEAANVPLVNVGDTMAYARTENQGNQSLTPNVDIDWTDIWTDDAVRTIDDPINYSYSTVATTLPVNLGGCTANWTEDCRITVNYEAHIQPLWETARLDSASMNRTCILCHTTYDTVGAALQVPAGKYQLDLTQNSPDAMGNPVDTQDPDYVKSYTELVGDDDIVEVMGATIVDSLFDDGMGNMVTRSVFAGTGVNRIMNRGSANNSNAFFEVFTEDYYNTYNGVAGRLPHWDPNGGGVGVGTPWLTTGELKLISEWIDVGGQYYNSPFAAPLN